MEVQSSSEPASRGAQNERCESDIDVRARRNRHTVGAWNEKWFGPPVSSSSSPNVDYISGIQSLEVSLLQTWVAHKADKFRIQGWCALGEATH